MAPSSGGRPRWLVIAFGLVVLMVVIVRMERGLTPPESASPREGAVEDDARKQQIRSFWEVYRRAEKLRMESQWEAAAAGYRQALAMHADHENSLYYLGVCLQMLGRYDEAVATFRRLTDTHPNSSPRGYMQLALIHASLDPGAPRDLKRAKEYFAKALAMDTDTGASLGLGEVAVLEEDWAEAEKQLMTVVHENQMSVAAPYLLGYVAWRQKEAKTALHWFRQAVARCRALEPSEKWSQEGDIRADPELRWQALARQSVFGKQWLRLRQVENEERVTSEIMNREYALLRAVIQSEDKPHGTR